MSLAYRNAGGSICKRRGTALPVEVHESAGKDYLAFQAKAKHSAFNKRIFNLDREHVLLYDDFEQVDCIPGSNVPFNLKTYKEMVGKKYNRISFYLCDKEEFW